MAYLLDGHHIGVALHSQVHKRAAEQNRLNHPSAIKRRFDAAHRPPVQERPAPPQEKPAAAPAAARVYGPDPTFVSPDAK